MRFSKTGPRGLALVALAAASTLFAAGCSAGSLGSSSGEGSAGAVTTTYLLGGSGDDTVASGKAFIFFNRKIVEGMAAGSVKG